MGLHGIAMQMFSRVETNGDHHAASAGHPGPQDRADYEVPYSGYFSGGKIFLSSEFLTSS